MSEKTNQVDTPNLNEDWKDLIKEMFTEGVKHLNNTKEDKEWSEMMLNKSYALTIGRDITTEERKFYEDRVVPLSCMNKIIALFDKGFDNTYAEFFPKALVSMLVCKDYLRPLFVEMRDRIENELKEKNLYHKGLEK